VNDALKISHLPLSSGPYGVGAQRPTPPHEERDSRDKETEKAATDFESLLLHQMLKSMWETIPKESLLGSSHEEELYRDMLNEALAKSFAEHKSIGIKDAVLTDMRKLEKKEPEPSS
jgi:peptidoglycan hydrolase FlgJ